TTTATEPGKAKAKKVWTAGKAGHCVTSLTKPGNPTTCYDTFTAAIAAATGGQITDAPADPGVAMKDKGLLERLNATGVKKSTGANQPIADVPIITLFCAEDFERCVIGGNSITYTGRPCDNSVFPVEWQVPYVGDDWNDWSESFRGFNNCWGKIFKDRDFGGEFKNFAPERASFGDLEDEV